MSNSVGEPCENNTKWMEVTQERSWGLHTTEDWRGKQFSWERIRKTDKCKEHPALIYTSVHSEWSIWHAGAERHGLLKRKLFATPILVLQPRELKTEKARNVRRVCNMRFVTGHMQSAVGAAIFWGYSQLLKTSATAEGGIGEVTEKIWRIQLFMTL